MSEIPKMQEIQSGVRESYSNYAELVSAGDIENAERLLKNNFKLRSSVIDAEILNKYITAIIALQTNSDDDINGEMNRLSDMIMSELRDWKDVGEYSAASEYKKFNVFTYEREVYMCIADAQPGKEPTNTTYFCPIGLEGEKGKAGLDMVWQGVYSANTQYQENDIVTINARLYRALQETKGVEPPNENVWELILSPQDGGGILEITEDEASKAPAGTLWMREI